MSQCRAQRLLEGPPEGKGLIKSSLLILPGLHKPAPTHLTHTKALLTEQQTKCDFVEMESLS